jgi:hypothetical protein
MDDASARAPAVETGNLATGLRTNRAIPPRTTGPAQTGALPNMPCPRPS